MSAMTGDPGVTVTVSGSNFLAASQVLWNGNSRVTTFQSATSLSAQITASDLATQGTASISVTNPAPGGGVSNPSSFAINASPTSLASRVMTIPLQGNDLAWDATHKRIYVSVPGTSSTDADTITVIDPVAGSVVSSVAAHSNPGALAISDDDHFLYAAVNSTGTVQRYVLPNLSPDVSWSFGLDPDFHSQYYAGEMKVAPGLPHTVAVSRWLTNVSPTSQGLLIYDDTTPRSNTAPVGNSYDAIQWKPDGTAIFAEDSTDTGLSFFDLSVDATGISQTKSFGSRFRYLGGRHLHLDPVRDLVYSDLGEVLDASGAVRVGSYSVNPGLTNPPSLSAVDAASGRVFFLTAIQGGSVFQIDVFDQTHFIKLGTFLIPNAVGVPTNFIRWGNAGLAFVTNDPHVLNSSTGQLYLVDGPFVSPSGAADSTGGTLLNPLPTVTSVNPPSVPVGSANSHAIVTGNNFSSAAAIQWNGQAVATTYDDATKLEFDVPAASLTVAGSNAVTVVNPGPGGGSSNALLVTTDAALSSGNQLNVYNVGGAGLVWSSTQQKFYVSVPSVNAMNGNTIVAIDPSIGAVTPSSFVGSEPTKLSLSDDGQFLYIGLNGSTSIQRMRLPGLIPDISWRLGAMDFEGPFYALDMKVAPGSPKTIAVTLGTFNVIPAAAGGVQIYDDATLRPTTAPGFGHLGNEYDFLEWGGNSATLYGANDTDFFVFTVTPTGVTLTQSNTFLFTASSSGLHFDPGTGLVYTDTGFVVNPATGALVHSMGASGLAAPDSSLNLGFFLGQTSAQIGTANYTLQSFDLTTYALVSTLPIPNLVGVPTGLVRWGKSGLAFTTEVVDPVFKQNMSPGRLYVLDGSFVSAAAMRAPVPASSLVQNTWIRQTEITTKHH